MKRLFLALALLSATPAFPQAALVPGVGQSQDKAGAVVAFENNAVTVQSIFPGSPLAAAGVEVGDKILQVSFEPITSFARYAQLVVEAQGNTAFTVQDHRSAQVRTVYANLGLAPLPPTIPAPTSQGWCRYKHKDRHGSVDEYDYFGNRKACTMGDRSVWYETCRDHQDKTDEVGCW